MRQQTIDGIEQVKTLKKKGMTLREIAKQLDTPYTTVQKWSSMGNKTKRKYVRRSKSKHEVTQFTLPETTTSKKIVAVVGDVETVLEFIRSIQ